ncbi:glycerol dehydrogenase [Olsenella sp. DNF00959]|uniref:glycerol dehydrogenase n=1 Tax=Olsenella sp. DNF00959 TaxID=1476999 RepID=UPI0007802C2C|nr:glycerol dehydrogenase [Olsenella sp. DNF00959]
MKRLRAMREPLKYVQGKGALLKFQEEMGYMGKRWLFVCSNSGYKACHDKIEQSFGDADDYRRYEVFGGISSKGEIAKMQAIVEADNIDAVVAVGGGSAVDTAKATAYYSGKKVVIIPTVAATDAPCTGLSVIYNDDGSFDKYLFYPENPAAVMVDTQVIADAPVRFLVAGMGDALGTYFEGRASIRTESPSLEGTGITRAGMALAKLCYETLRDYSSQAIVACQNHVVTPAFENVVEACVYLSGVGADNVNCAAAHSFYNGLTSLGGHSAPHGNCVAFGTLVQLVLEGVPEEEFVDVQDYCLEVGLPTTLAELGVTTDEQIWKIAEAACVPGETIHNLAGDVIPDELHDAIVATDAMGKALRGE